MSYKSYFANEFRCRMLGLDHPKPWVFHASSCKKSPCPIPLLVLRSILFLLIIAIICYSTWVHVETGIYKFWFIYLTHWGLTTVLLATASGLIVSIMALVRKAGGEPPCGCADMRWYMKVSWIFYNIANSLALFISIFYWTILHERVRGPNAEFKLSFATHAVNSMLMLTMVFSSTVPSRILHVYQPCLFASLWAIFSVIYYYAGGLNPMGNHWIYPVIDWTKPLSTISLLAGAGVGIFFLHLVIVAFSCLRDWIVAKVQGKEDTQR